jgi:hypothetical protein
MKHPKIGLLTKSSVASEQMTDETDEIKKMSWNSSEVGTANLPISVCSVRTVWATHLYDPSVERDIHEQVHVSCFAEGRPQASQASFEGPLAPVEKMYGSIYVTRFRKLIFHNTVFGRNFFWNTCTFMCINNKRVCHLSCSDLYFLCFVII